MKQTPFSTMSPAFMWGFAAFLGIPGLYDLIQGLRLHLGQQVFHAAGALALAAFLVWYALQRRAGRTERLASPRATLVGYVCLGLCVGGFLAKLAGKALQVFG
ncbi:hypothetical protein [Massilia sp. DD77]|uniref:hypothetical protein n=1 Tax=Massilia sp. DD77 TaxID=3109349 RepID=UPI0030006DEF